jgi:parallel beta helix pectate lyase-like protein
MPAAARRGCRGSLRRAGPALISLASFLCGVLAAALLLVPRPAVAYGPIPGQVCVGVKMSPGASLQSAVDRNPPGTIFCLAPGIYLRQTVIPKNNDQFIGLYGAVLDGVNSTAHAFAGSATGVVIQNLKITHYDPPAQDSAVYGLDGNRWIVKNNDITYNGGAGVDVGDHMQVVGNEINHNLQIGVDMNGFGRHPGFDILVDSNEIAYNNYAQAYRGDWEAGGAKFWNSINLTVSNNYVHDNVGPGLWTDTNNIGTTYAGNVIENNLGPGIEHEVSYDAVIRNNIIRNNGSSDPHKCTGWMWCAAVLISASGGAATTDGRIDIYGNVVVPGRRGNGISLVQANRQDLAEYGPHIVRHVDVHDNIVDLDAAPDADMVRHGADSDDHENLIFTDRDNRFSRNTYYLRWSEKPFSWFHQQGDAQFWRSMGQDRDGMFFFGSSVYSDRIGPTAALSAQPAILPPGGGEVTLAWVSSHAISCTARNFPVADVTGTVTVQQAGTARYTLTCSGPGGSQSASVRVPAQ